MADPLEILSDEECGLLEDEDFPSWVDPMLATLVDEPFSDDDWIYERKLDGERCLAFVGPDGARLMSRNGKDITVTYPELADALDRSQTPRCVVDGEVVAFDKGLTSFQRLQGRMQVKNADEARRSAIAVHLYLFDILHVDGVSPRDIPLRRRKELLKRSFSFRDPLRFTPHRNREGVELYAEACRSGWEGLIAKDARSRYVGTRSKDWLKFKCVGRQELVVGGFTEPRGTRCCFGALLVGYYEEDRLVYAGKVGTGYDEETLRSLGSRLGEMEQPDPPFESGDPPSQARWVRPELVVEVGFTEWTDGGRLRHPRFLGMRRDKDAGDVVREPSR